MYVIIPLTLFVELLLLMFSQIFALMMHFLKRRDMLIV